MLRIILVVSLVVIVSAQLKQGSCPPAPNIGLCSLLCSSDSNCLGDAKCCRTACGGSVCLRPVTAHVQNSIREKSGYCPSTPSGPWVCTSRCRADGDCRGASKCCKNRCGAMACTKPSE